MTHSIDRQTAIRKGKRMQQCLKVMRCFQSLFRRRKQKTQRDEWFVETAFGKVRVLCYGFEDPKVSPVFFELHGGGFILDSADVDHDMNRKFEREAGCKIISIDYAKAPEHPFPAAVNQVHAIAEHVHDHAGEFGIDPERMAIGGHSSGGNLSAAACLKAGKEGKFQFACQILDYAVFDLATDPHEKPSPKGSVPPDMALIFNACYVDPVQAKHPYASPVYARPEDLVGLPPALFILAGRDSLCDEGKRYCEMLKEAGVITESYVYPEAAHGFTLQSTSDADDAIGKMIVFLQKYLGTN